MDIKQQFKALLHQAAWFTDKLLDEISSPEDWVCRAAPGTNHPLWILGHIAYTQNAFVGMADPARSASREGYGKLFGRGSTPLDDASAYPPPDDMRAYLQERRGAFLEVLDGLDAEGLACPTPEGAPKFLPDVASLFPMWAWHETIHSGQLSTVHRVLGNQALSDRG